MYSRQAALLALAGLWFAAAGCAPPSPTMYSLTVDAGTEHWQSQINGEAPGASILVEQGDVVTLDVSGRITYRRSYRGLVTDKSGPRGDRSPTENTWCPDARIGSVIWCIGDSDECMYLDEADSITFTADRAGPLRFMVNDTRGGYGDNSGSFHVATSVRHN